MGSVAWMSVLIGWRNLCGLLVLAVGASPVFGKDPLQVPQEASMCSQAMIQAVARQEIEYLRREYAKATDMIGLGTPEAIAEGRSIYQRIFTPDVDFSVSGSGTQPLAATGPDGWVDVVHGALGPMGPTQHLIGTQLVEFDVLEWDEQCVVTSGAARMQSYVQAWHDQAEREVWLFLGTYFDEVVYGKALGWQIKAMELRRVTGENRPSGEAVATVPL
ncbi:MAG: nuclear transport factor 2 family protein [Gammaproteobacteria bacterium TMED182]|nr:hypothetical protein [Gammaproteobacteria bacterium]RPG57091.1 MAG: nuclear transport factor 2 family protein [Gammaproteobacteria bacterium TMED182]